MNELLRWVIFIAVMLLSPPLAIGIIRKLKAWLQNRVGAPIWQPYLDLIKFLRKGETVSHITSWVLRGTSVINLSLTLLVAICLPWLSLKPELPGADLFLVIYLLAFTRMMTVLAALDAGSPFGGFGASREVTLALLVEPGFVLCLVSLGCLTRSSDLTQIFSYSANSPLAHQPGLWILCGISLFLASIVELSRMPSDDPTTHLELTMVHEAMILENSGKNLALVEYTHALKLLVLFGTAGQCFLHAIPLCWRCNEIMLALSSVAFAILPLISIALIEGTQVKLRWTKIPEFIAYSVGIALICAFVAVGRG